MRKAKSFCTRIALERGEIPRNRKFIHASHHHRSSRSRFCRGREIFLCTFGAFFRRGRRRIKKCKQTVNCLHDVECYFQLRAFPFVILDRAEDESHATRKNNFNFKLRLISLRSRRFSRSRGFCGVKFSMSYGLLTSPFERASDCVAIVWIA